ncbi:MAG TPA: hypothetical protein K8W04_07355, partial [Bacteroides reticulotermitis]|nr:hypothetical protein [Bacteroides reticulotermitis]
FMSCYFLLHILCDACSTLCGTRASQYVSQLFHNCGTGNIIGKDAFYEFFTTICRGEFCQVHSLRKSVLSIE